MRLKAILGGFVENLKSWRVPEPIEESVDDRGKSWLDERGQGTMEGARGHRHTAEAWFWVQKPSFVLFKGILVGGLEEREATGCCYETLAALHSRQTFCSS